MPLAHWQTQYHPSRGHAVQGPRSHKVSCRAADTDRATSFSDIGDHHDFRVVRDAPALAKDIELDLAEATSERDLPRRAEALATEEDDAMTIVGILDGSEGFVIQGTG